MKVRIIAVFAVAVALIAACAKPETEVKKVASVFIEAIAMQNYTKALEIVTEESKPTLQMLSNIYDSAKEMATESGQELKVPESVSFKIDSIIMNGDKATVKYSVEGTEGTQTLDMVKKDGTWKAVFNKQM